jgi:hypothetical protein
LDCRGAILLAFIEAGGYPIPFVFRHSQRFGARSWVGDVEPGVDARRFFLARSWRVAWARGKADRMRRDPSSRCGRSASTCPRVAFAHTGGIGLAFANGKYLQPVEHSGSFQQVCS